jgi:hypothetical protein
LQVIQRFGEHYICHLQGEYVRWAVGGRFLLTALKENPNQHIDPKDGNCTVDTFDNLTFDTARPPKRKVNVELLPRKPKGKKKFIRIDFSELDSELLRGLRTVRGDEI